MMATLLPQQEQATCTVDGQPVRVVRVDVETESIDVSTMSNVEPDPKWEFVDAAGHFHAYTADGKTPTLQERKEKEYWCEDCHEHHTTYITGCVLCGEEIRPRTINHGPQSKSIPGRVTWTVRVIDLPYMSTGPVSMHLIDRGREYFGVMHPGTQRVEPGRPVETVLVGFLHRRSP